MEERGRVPAASPRRVVGPRRTPRAVLCPGGAGRLPLEASVSSAVQQGVPTLSRGCGELPCPGCSPGAGGHQTQERPVWSLVPGEEPGSESRRACGSGPGPRAVCLEPVQESGGCELRVGTRHPPGALILGLGTGEEMQAPEGQGAQLGVQPEALAKQGFPAGLRGEHSGWQRPPAHPPPRPLGGGPRGSLWLGGVGLEEGSPTPRAPPPRPPLAGRGGGGRKCPPPWGLLECPGPGQRVGTRILAQTRCQGLVRAGVRSFPSIWPRNTSRRPSRAAVTTRA